MLDNKKDQLEHVVEEKIENTKIQWSDLASELANDENNFVLAVDKRIESKINHMSDAIHTTQDLITSTRMQAVEERDREQRRNNIVIYRVPESTSTLLKDRTANDTWTVLKFFNEGLHVGVDEEEIQKVVRLGKYNYIQSDTSENPSVRPLLVSFTNYGVKNLIMNSLYKLKSAGQLFKWFIVTHDMTVWERAQCKDKVQEARTKASADGLGEYRYVVRGQPGRMEVVTFRIRQ